MDGPECNVSVFQGNFGAPLSFMLMFLKANLVESMRILHLIRTARRHSLSQGELRNYLLMPVGLSKVKEKVKVLDQTWQNQCLVEKLCQRRFTRGLA